MSTPACSDWHGGAMPEHVGGNVLLCCAGHVVRAVLACRATGGSTASRLGAGRGWSGRADPRGRAALVEPGPEQPHRLCGERGAAFLAALAQRTGRAGLCRVHVGIGGAPAGELEGTRSPGLDGDREQGVIAQGQPAGSGLGAASRASASLVVRKDTEVFSKRAGGMAQDALDEGGVLGVAEGGVAGRGRRELLGGQPRVAGGRAVAPVFAAGTRGTRR